MPQYTIDEYAFQLEAGSNRKGLFVCRSAGQVRGWVAFYEDGSSLPAPTLDADQRITLSLPASRMTAVMDLFRNEKPVKLYFNSATFAGLSVSGEPVGEHEL